MLINRYGEYFVKTLDIWLITKNVYTDIKFHTQTWGFFVEPLCDFIFGEPIRHYDKISDIENDYNIWGNFKTEEQTIDNIKLYRDALIKNIHWGEFFKELIVNYKNYRLPDHIFEIFKHYNKFYNLTTQRKFSKPIHSTCKIIDDIIEVFYSGSIVDLVRCPFFGLSKLKRSDYDMMSKFNTMYSNNDQNLHLATLFKYFKEIPKYFEYINSVLEKDSISPVSDILNIFDNSPRDRMVKYYFIEMFGSGCLNHYRDSDELKQIYLTYTHVYESGSRTFLEYNEVT